MHLVKTFDGPALCGGDGPWTYDPAKARCPGCLRIDRATRAARRRRPSLPPRALHDAKTCVSADYAYDLTDCARHIAKAIGVPLDDVLVAADEVASRGRLRGEIRRVARDVEIRIRVDRPQTVEIAAKGVAPAHAYLVDLAATSFLASVERLAART